MSNINETQRKYLRSRAEAMYKQKLQEITNSQNTANRRFGAWEDGKEKQAYMQAEFDRVGLDFTITPDGWIQGVVTPKDRQYLATVKEEKDRAVAITNQLREVYNTTMDSIVLGDEADDLRAALESISNFVVTTGETN